MIDIEKLTPLIVERLKPLNPEKIILFGSYAYGTPNEESDIDLYIVTNDDFIPQTWKEKSQIYKQFSKKLRELRKLFAIDLIVHTKKMHIKFIALNSSFSREIMQKGKVIYG